MADNFTTGEMDADMGAPPFETMGPRYGINFTIPQTGRGAHEPLTEPYLMPSVHYRNGNMERVPAAITLTPLGGLMPGPNAIAPAIPSGNVGAVFTGDHSQEAMEFGMGVEDSWPEGSPVPY
jgi:hypothetical protein